MIAAIEKNSVSARSRAISLVVIRPMKALHQLKYWPPRPSSVRSRTPFNSSMSVSELVITVSGTVARKCWAICSAVVESSMKMAWPGSTNCMAARATALFSRDCRRDR